MWCRQLVVASPGDVDDNIPVIELLGASRNPWWKCNIHKGDPYLSHGHYILYMFKNKM